MTGVIARTAPRLQDKSISSPLHFLERIPAHPATSDSIAFLDFSCTLTPAFLRTRNENQLILQELES